MIRVRSWGRAAGIAAAVLLVAGSPGLSSPAPDAPPETAPRTAPRAEVLRALVERSSQSRFYVVLEPHAGTLTLMYRGLVARRYPVTSCEVGSPRIAFVSRRPPAAIAAAAWTGGTLDPLPVKERHTLSVNSQGERQGPEPPLLPPTPEEAIPAPGRYLLAFEGGVEIEILADEPKEEDAEGRGGWMEAIGARMRALLSALRPDAESVLRIRLRMPAREAASLYRGLPPGVDLVILPAPAGEAGQARLR